MSTNIKTEKRGRGRPRVLSEDRASVEWTCEARTMARAKELAFQRGDSVQQLLRDLVEEEWARQTQ